MCCFILKDNRLITGETFVDFQKAFHSINHKILLKYLACIGVVGCNIKWLSYFNHRQISIQNGKYESISRILRRGTALLKAAHFLDYSSHFSLYINMLPEKFKSSEVILYADNLVFWFSSTSLDDLKQRTQEDVDELQHWCNNNNMRINVPKTKCMIISPPRVKISLLNIVISAQMTEQVKSFKYLGVVIDEHLSWNEQYEEVCDKMSQRICQMNLHNKGITQKYFQIFCTTIVLSILHYCYAAWGILPTQKLYTIDLCREAKFILPNHNCNTSQTLQNTSNIRKSELVVCSRMV
jgi:hypothetical protein